MGFAIEGREMELISFLASLEANSKKGNLVAMESGEAEEVGDRTLLNET